MFEIVDEKWTEYLSGCPNQCYLRVRFNGELYTIYLRWRHRDPWTCELFKGDLLNCHSSEEAKQKGWYFCSPELFSLYGYFFKEDELRKAEETAVELAKMYLERVHSNRCVKCGREARWKAKPYYAKYEYPLCSDHYIEWLHGYIRWLMSKVKTVEQCMIDVEKYIEHILKG